jgi:hypothetical protein
MPRGFPLADDWNRCRGRSRQTGLRCKRSAIPFGDFCIFHGGNQPAHRAKAEERMNRYAEGWHGPLDSPDPVYVRRIKVQAWERSNDRYQRRLERKRAARANRPNREKARAGEPIPWEMANWDWDELLN